MNLFEFFEAEHKKYKDLKENNVLLIQSANTLKKFPSEELFQRRFRGKNLDEYRMLFKNKNKIMEGACEIFKQQFKIVAFLFKLATKYIPEFYRVEELEWNTPKYYFYNLIENKCFIYMKHYLVAQYYKNQKLLEKIKYEER